MQNALRTGIIACLLIAQSLSAQKPVALTVQTFTNFSHPDVEPAQDYHFGAPVWADILNENPNTYSPAYANRYFMSLFGPRHKQVSTSNIEYFDYHKGEDLTADVVYGGVTYSASNPPVIHCMCDGVVHEIQDGTEAEMEATETGRFVTVQCDSTFHGNPNWGPVFMAYRHLSSVADSLTEGRRLAIGDTIGVMGSSGATSTVHLHLSVIRMDGNDEINVHPMRIFNPDSIPHLLSRLQQAEIFQLGNDGDSALFRIVVPYNQINFREIRVSLPDSAYERVYDFEVISELPTEERDDNDAVDGLELFAYPFNRGHDAYRRMWDRYDDGELPGVYPASPDAANGYFSPFLSEELLRTPAYVLDLKVKDLPPGYDISDLEIEIIDIYGYGVRVNGVAMPDTAFAWSMINAQNNDAEENKNGVVNVNDTDLELVYDYSANGNQKVGLRFPDLQIPQGSVITNAFIQFRADATHSGATALTIKAQNAGNAAVFTSAANSVSTRPMTTANVFWEPAPWTQGDMGPVQKLSGLQTLVQEVVNRGDWAAGNAMAFIITGTGRREAEAFNNNSWNNAYLYVEYTEPEPPSGQTTGTSLKAAGEVLPALYPNPLTTGSTLHVRFNEPVSGPVRLALQNMEGRLVYTQTLTADNQRVLSLEPIAVRPGIYVLQIELAGRAYSERLTVME